MREFAAGGVVYRKKEDKIEILLIEDRYGRWTLPKGKREAGETDEQNALREIKEETGIIGKIISKLHTVQYEYLHSRYGLVNKEVTYFLVEATDGVEKPQIEEIRRVAWFTPEEAHQRQINYGYENNNYIFDLAFEQLKLK